MRVGITGSLALPSTGAFHYHDWVFTRDEACPAKWGRSRITSLAQTGVIRLGSMFVAHGPTLAALADKLNEFHLPAPFVLVVVAQEPDPVALAKAMAWTRSDQQWHVVSVNEATVSEAFLGNGLEVIDRSGEPSPSSYSAPTGLVPMALPAKAAPAKPPAPKKKPKVIEAEPPSAPPEPETPAAE
jgi:hypothetical protein